MKATLKQPLPLIYPIPIILAGTLVNDVPNYATIGDTGLMGIKPPLVFISSHVNHYTNRGLLSHKTFSINVPATDMLEKVDYCGIVSGAEEDKSALFTNFFGKLSTAPMIEECPVNLECKVVKEFKIEHRHIFVGEVVATYVDSHLLVHEGEDVNLPRMSDLNPIMYALDNFYYQMGTKIGTGYQEGQMLVKTI